MKSFDGGKCLFRVMERPRSEFGESESSETMEKVVGAELRQCGVWSSIGTHRREA